MVNIKKNIEKNFIWRDPLDSEEAKAMALEETVPHVDDEEAGNIVYSCPKHGKETYFSIKKLERCRRCVTMYMCGLSTRIDLRRCG
jgi:predicted RNA-binding Zn-ribbon protein involved in translation (DUF1610 family)